MPFFIKILISIREGDLIVLADRMIWGIEESFFLLIKLKIIIEKLINFLQFLDQN